jgi:hypothetical protein
MMRLTLALTACAGLAGALLVGPAVAAAAATPSTVPIMMQLSGVQGAGTVEVDLQTPVNIDAQGVPQELDDSPVTTVAVTGGAATQVNIPVTAAVLAQAPEGLATFEFFIRFGTSEATSTESLPVTAGAIAAASGSDPASVPTATLSAFTPQGQPDPPVPCVWSKNGAEVEGTNRIGQMQTSTASGSHATFTYSGSADSTFGVGVSDSPSANYTLDGHFSVSNSIGSSGGLTVGAGFNHFISGHFYRQRYESDAAVPSDPFCGHLYKTEWVSAVGDAFAGTNSPAVDPYGRCGQDPNGHATLQANGGFYGADRGKGASYSVGATIYDLSVSAETGYTNDIHIQYTNSSSGAEYVCGNGLLPAAPKLWSNDNSGN